MIPSADRPRQLAALYRMVARLASAGIPPVQRAALLEESPAGAHARAASDAFVRAFASGGLPSEELARARAVPAEHVGVVAAGETTGRLDVVLDLLASGCEEQARVAGMAQRLMIEPIAAWLVIALILPLGKLISGGLGAYVAHALPVLALPIVVAIVLAQLHRSGGVVPGFTEPIRLLALARSCRTFAMLQAAGLPLPRSLRLAAGAAGHPAIAAAAQQTAAGVERGATLTESLRRSGMLRPVEMSLVADGELTGRLDAAFSRAAGLLEHEGFAKARTRLRVVAAILFAIVVVIAAVSLAGAILPRLTTEGGA